MRGICIWVYLDIVYGNLFLILRTDPAWGGRMSVGFSEYNHILHSPCPRHLNERSSLLGSSVCNR